VGYKVAHYQEVAKPRFLTIPQALGIASLHFPKWEMYKKVTLFGNPAFYDIFSTA
jgi:hypothetical protein